MLVRKQNKTHKQQQQHIKNPETPNPKRDNTWDLECEKLIKAGYSYNIACALVSKQRIAKLFEEDKRIIS